MEQKKLELELVQAIKTFSSIIATEREERVNKTEPLKFGVGFLDEALGGIYHSDLIVVGAKTGIGKTELAIQIAKRNVELGKRVHFFALEAEDKEIERRIKYKVVSDVFYNVIVKQYQENRIDLNFMDWYYGKLDHVLGPYETEIDVALRDTYGTLSTFYRNRGDYTIDDFEKQFMAIKNETDLVIVDHLHYFDFDDDNENRAMKKIVKKCRDLALLGGKPVVLVAHVRKSDKRGRALIPDVDDFHGSSDISKIATKAVIIAPAYKIECLDKRLFWTFVRIVKCRVDNSRTRMVGALKYNVVTNRYEDGYLLGKLSNWDEDVDFVTNSKDLPRWSKTGRVSGNA